MRLYFLVAIGLLLITEAYTQNTSFNKNRYLQLARTIDQDKGMKKIYLENEDFLEHALDGGGELTGYFHNGELRKIHCWLGYSWGTDEKDFYLQNNQLAYVHHIVKRFIFDDSTGNFLHDSLEAPFTGQYFFGNGKLLHYMITETGHHFESEQEDIEVSVKDQFEELRRALKKKQAEKGVH